MSRKESRKQAFQTLFQLEMKNTDLTINEAINFIKDDYPDLDWTIARLLKTDRIILRMATFELLHSDTPPKVIINEAVELTKQFSDEGHYKFINGVLSNIK